MWKLENCENAQNVQKAQNVQNVHQHMLSTFRDKPGTPRVRTVPDSPGRARRPPQGPAAFTSQSRAMWPCPAQPSLALPSCPGDQGVCPVCRGKPGHVQAMWRAMLPMTVTSHPGLSEGLGSLLCCLGDCEVRPQSLSPWVGQKLNFSLEENWRKV